MSDHKTAESFGSYTLFVSGAPKRFREASKRDLGQKELNQLESAALGIGIKPDNVFIHGPQGRGKSHCAAALLRELAVRFMLAADGVEMVQFPGNPFPRFVRRNEDGVQTRLGFTARWVFVPQLLDEARAAVRSDDENPFDGLADVDVLVLDDLGMHKASVWVADSLYALVGTRYDAMRTTITTSNMDPKGLAETLDPRLASRLVGGYRITVDGGDRRLER